MSLSGLLSKVMPRAVTIIAALVLGVLAAGGAVAQAKSISFFTDKEKDGGFLLAITKAALEKEGYEAKIVYMPWARALDGVIRGEADGLLGAQYTQERAAKMQFSDPVGYSEMVFFKLKTTKVDFEKLDDLKGLIIGTINQSAYTPEFDSATYLTKAPAPDYLTNIRKLLAGRFPLFLEKKYVVLNALATQFPDDVGKVDYLGVPLKKLTFFDCFSKAVPGYEQKVKDFNAGLAAITKDGTYQAIMSKNLHE